MLLATSPRHMRLVAVPLPAVRSTIQCRICLYRRPYSSSHTPPPPPPRQRTRFRWPYPLGLSVALLPGLYWFLSTPQKPLSPQFYSTQTVSSNTTLSPAHKLVSVTIPPSARSLFAQPYKADGTQAEDGEIVVQHMMLGAPDIQIERPYTPVNDPLSGEAEMVIKRVRGGEVGRLAHSVRAGEALEVRGPIPTFSIKPSEYDRIVMVSTGTGVAPFLQLLSRMTPSPPPSNGPRLDLVHLQPGPDRVDWAVSAGFIPSLQEKHGEGLIVHRPTPGQISAQTMREAVGATKGERIMVLVCLPPHLMYPLCGGLTRTLQQGPLTGLLADLGLRQDQVWKLE